ncbi:MAG: DnaD domain protein [Clostridia bacterium]|nr:DnaD domain protein [Clostridia bacterium]
MAFSTFSKDFSANMFTSVENQFITKYLPQANGDAVRVYLYGLYLCQCAEDLDANVCAKLLRMSPSKLLEIFEFWEECDLVHILSKDPLYVQYLPVNHAVGTPKPIKAEKYAEFNRELYKILQRAKKTFRPYEMQRFLEFLENNPMEPQAFLLVCEYCAKKDGERLSAMHILNKAAALCKEHKYTFEQVDREFADYHIHEKDLQKIFTLLGIRNKIQDTDYDFLDKWLSLGMSTDAIFECASYLKKGTLFTLDQLISELDEKNVHSHSEAIEYLANKKLLTEIVYKVAQKLSVKVENPRTLIEDYAEKWQERGYDKDSLVLLASVYGKLNYGFQELNTLLEELYAQGIVDFGGIEGYCKARNEQLRLLQKIQAICGVVKKSQYSLDMVAAWKSWSFSEEVILEAAKRSASTLKPLSYMNRLLSEWKRQGVVTVSDVSSLAVPSAKAPAPYKNESAVAADLKSEREHYYAVLRSRAVAKAEHVENQAKRDKAFLEAESELRKGEIELARAEVFNPESVPVLRKKMEDWQAKRTLALQRLGIAEEDLLPAYTCKKCSDSGFLPNGKMCDCYPKA